MHPVWNNSDIPVCFVADVPTGPQYEYTEQKASASIGVGQTISSDVVQWHGSTSQSPYAGDSKVFIDKIDGLEANFPAVTTFPFFDARKQLNISPGKHTLAIILYKGVPESKGPNHSIAFGVEVNGMGTVTAEFYG